MDIHKISSLLSTWESRGITSGVIFPCTAEEGEEFKEQFQELYEVTVKKDPQDFKDEGLLVVQFVPRRGMVI